MIRSIRMGVGANADGRRPVRHDQGRRGRGSRDDETSGPWRAVLAKSTPGERKTDEELDRAIRQIISTGVVSDEVLDIFAAAGLKKPDISSLPESKKPRDTCVPHLVTGRLTQENRHWPSLSTGVSAAAASRVRFRPYRARPCPPLEQPRPPLRLGRVELPALS